MSIEVNAQTVGATQDRNSGLGTWLCRKARQTVSSAKRSAVVKLGSA